MSHERCWCDYWKQNSDCCGLSLHAAEVTTKQVWNGCVSGASVAASTDSRGRRHVLVVCQAGRASTLPGCTGGDMRRRGRAQPALTSPVSRTVLDAAIEILELLSLLVACYLLQLDLPTHSSQTCRHHLPVSVSTFTWTHAYTIKRNLRLQINGKLIAWRK